MYDEGSFYVCIAVPTGATPPPADPAHWSLGGDYGAPIRCNGNLVWNGINYIWLNPNLGDAVEVAGDIKYATMPYSNLAISSGAVQATFPAGAPWTYVNGQPALDSAATAIDPSDPTGQSRLDVFNSGPDLQSGASLGDYRDGRIAADYYGRPRNVTRIEPPLVDPSAITGGLNAYRDVTRNSGLWQYNSSSSQWYNTGYYGWGQGLYINNPADSQTESSLYTLRGDWTEPGRSNWWIGSYYAPPGVKIEFTPYNIDGLNNGAPELIISHDTGPNQPEFHWYDQSGNVVYSAGEQVIMPYPANGVIFAEGNVRIKGTLPQGKQLTVVSEGTIYVEGNILKCPFTGASSTGYLQTCAEGSPRNSAISLLAQNYVCVNTTQFFAPTSESLSAENNTGYLDISPDKPFWMSFSYGPYWDKNGNQKYLDPSGAPMPNSIYLRHSSDPSKVGLTYMNMLVNYWTIPICQITNTTHSIISIRMAIVVTMPISLGI